MHSFSESEKTTKPLEVNPSKSIFTLATIPDGILQLSVSSTILPKSGFRRRGKGAWELRRDTISPFSFRDDSVASGPHCRTFSCFRLSGFSCSPVTLKQTLPFPSFLHFAANDSVWENDKLSLNDDKSNLSFLALRRRWYVLFGGSTESSTRRWHSRRDVFW